LGRAAITPTCPLQTPDPRHLLLCPVSDTSSDSDVPDLLASHQEG